MIVNIGGRSIAVRPDEPSAAYVGTDVVRRTCAGLASSANSVRTVVELSQAFGGMTMRALLGAAFTPDMSAPVTIFEIPVAGPMGLGELTGCQSQLGRPLVAGLPSDFVEPTLEALLGVASTKPLPAGLLRIDRAAYDEVGSSTKAFGLAGDLLLKVIAAQLNGDDLTKTVKSILDSW